MTAAYVLDLPGCIAQAIGLSPILLAVFAILLRQTPGGPDLPR
jgi:hypothetical protein